MVDKRQDRKKTGLKIASVIMSLLLWFYVINQGDMTAGAKTMNVALQYHNIPGDLNVSGPEQVTVKLWGAFHGTANIVAYVDLTGMGEGVHQLPVKLESIQGAMFTSVQPSQVEVKLDKLSEKALPIKQEVRQNPPTGYQVASVLLSPDHCQVRGSAEAVAQVTTVAAPLDLGNVNDIATVKSTLQAIDADGKVISEGIQLVPATIDVTVVLEKKQLSKKVNVKPQYSGTAATGFTLGEVKSDPAQVTILGDQTRVEALNEITTTPIDISGQQQDFTTLVELVQPEGVVLSPTRVNVSVKVTKNVVSGVQ
jgi:YbbR domain-containing protein